MFCLKNNCISFKNNETKLNEKQKDYEDALINLKFKCIRSYFIRKLVNNTFNELNKLRTKNTTKNFFKQNKVKKRL